MLKDEATERYLPICIGESQAKSIENELIKRKPSEERSLSLEEISSKEYRLKSIIIDRFVDNVFYSKLIVERDNKCHELECQTSKAIILALREGAPILVDEMVLDKAELDSVFNRGMKDKGG